MFQTLDLNFVIIQLNYFRQVSLPNICCLLLSYVFFSHITFIGSTEELHSDKYVGILLFDVGGLDVYLSLFSWLKIEGVGYLLDNSVFSVSIEDFTTHVDGTDPHSLFLSSTLFGGLVFAILLY